MLNRFRQQLEELKINKTDKVLVAVSAGVDSMVLADLLLSTGYNFGVAYVDHNTRAGQSTEDGLFVKKFADNKGLPFHIYVFNNIKNSGNFHNEAHIARYQFFASLNYDIILTAHHYDDQVETIFINFLNGRSVAGIPVQNGKVLRPLLPFSKQEIRDYASTNQVAYREDSTNSENNYLRNLIRNEVLPSLKAKLDNDVGTRIVALSKRALEDEKLLESLIKKSSPLTNKDSEAKIDIDKLKLYDHTYLYHLIKEYGFSRDLCTQIYRSLDNKGAQFYSSTNRCVVGSGELIIVEEDPLDRDISEEPLAVSLEHLPLSIIVGNYKFSLTISTNQDGLTEPDCCLLPLSLLTKGILVVRAWKDGDAIKPYGLAGKSKKLKKVYSDNKLNLLEKKSLPIFTHDKEIVWVTSLMSSDSYRITETEPYLRIQKL